MIIHESYMEFKNEQTYEFNLQKVYYKKNPT